MGKRILCTVALAVLSSAALGGCGNAETHASTDPDLAFVEAAALEAYPGTSSEKSTSRLVDLVNELRAVPALAPLLEAYGVLQPVTLERESVKSLAAFLRAVKITVNGGTVTILNRSTGAVVFTGPSADLVSGTYYPENVPGGGPPPACTYTYSAWGPCEPTGTQTRTVEVAAPTGCTGTPVTSQSCTYGAPACTSFSYSAWGACQPGNVQTRTVLTSSPSGCTGGAPATTQPCTYVPPTCTTFTYSAWGACQPTSTQTRTVLTSSPSGCTGGGPVTSQSCTYTAPTCTSFTYSAWSACTSGSQTRTVVSSAPAGCTGGSPPLTQSCGGGVLAFPGAEGFGAHATGGRGGQVIKVTNLNASGPGSLQAALAVNAPRIIVFAVSGVISANVDVPYGNVTIAGQTAPGGGITIAGRLTGAYTTAVGNIIVRHIRVRPPRCGTGCDATQYDAIQFSRNSRLILDHVSVAYGADETIDVYEASDVTVQWTTIEASQIAPHPNGQPTHNYGFIQGPDGHRITFHHNACANHYMRCPAIANGPADVRNNVVHNVKHAFVHHNDATGQFNLVGNYFKDGPSANLYPFYFDDENLSSRPTYFTLDSWMSDAGAGVNRRIDDIWTDHYWGDLFLDSSYRSATAFDFRTAYPDYVPVTTESSTDAYASVLARAGAFPRDGFTAQTISQIQAGTGAWDPPLPADLMAGLTPGTPPVDADGDGMADAWELAHGLDPANGTDHKVVMPSGYTAIEEYVNELADTLAH